MRKFLALILVAFAAVVSAQTVTTPNIGLQLPAAGSTNWNLPLNYNFNLLDQLFGGPLIPGAKVAYQPLFSNGSPTAPCGVNNQGQVDFDYSITPYGQYTCRTTTWAQVGGSGGGGGASFPSLPGVVWNTSTIASRNATYADLVGLWSGCSSGQLSYNGTCTNNITGNAATTTSFQTAPTTCQSGQYQYGSDSRGNALCTALPAQPGQQYIGPQVLSGCGVQYVSGLTYTVGACTYNINGVTYNSPLSSITLPTADPSNPQIDVIFVDTTQTVQVIAGTPAVTPEQPTLNSASQLGLTFVLVPAGSTTPANTIIDSIYLNNVGWSYSVKNNVNGASTNNPYTGTYDVEFGFGGPAVSNSSPSFESAIDFTSPSGPITVTNFNDLIFYVRNKVVWPSNCSFSAVWLDSLGNFASNPVTLNSGQFGFSTSNISSYQQVAIPTNTFQNFSPASYLYFYVNDNGTTCSFAGLYIDDVSLQGGVGGPSLPTTLMNYKGVYSTAVAYNQNDVVTSSLGVTYVALGANTNVPLTTTSTWQVLGGGNTISAPLTTNVLPKATGSSILGDSKFSDDGTNGAYTGTGGLTAPNYKTNGPTNGFQDLTSVGTPNAVPVTNSVRVSAPDTVTTPYEMKLPSTPPPDGTHIYFNCTFANPSVCNWGTGGGTTLPSTTQMLQGNGSGGAVATSVNDSGTVVTSTEPVDDNTTAFSTPAGLDTNTGTAGSHWVLGRFVVCPNLTSGGQDCDIDVGNTTTSGEGTNAQFRFVYHGSSSTNRGALGMGDVGSLWPIDAFEWDLAGNAYLPNLPSQGSLGTDGTGKIIGGTGGSTTGLIGPVTVATNAAWGVSTSNTAAQNQTAFATIASAVNAGTTSAHVYLPSGTYNVLSTGGTALGSYTTINKTIVFECADPASTIINHTGTGSLISMGTAGTFGSSTLNWTPVIFENCQVTGGGSASDGIFVPTLGGSQVFIKNNYFFNYGSASMACQVHVADNNQVTLEGNVFWRYDHASVCHAWAQGNSTYNLMTAFNNSLICSQSSTNGNTQVCGMGLRSDGYMTAYGNTMSGPNPLFNCGSGGTSGISNCGISNNPILEQFGTYGITFGTPGGSSAETTNNLQVNNNTVFMNPSTTTSFIGPANSSSLIANSDISLNHRRSDSTGGTLLVTLNNTAGQTGNQAIGSTGWTTIQTIGSNIATWSTGGTTSNALTMNNGGSGAASGTTFDGSVARTISYNTLGAAPLASPTFTGVPAAPTPAPGTNTTQLATMAALQAAIAGVTAGAAPVVYSGPSLTLSGTLYLPIGGGGLASTTETNVDLDSPAAATIQNFSVQMSAAPGVGNTVVFTWRKNAAGTALTCTITGASQTACNDATHTITVVQGDLMDIQAVTTGTIVGTPTLVMGTQFGIAASSGVSSLAATSPIVVSGATGAVTTSCPTCTTSTNFSNWINSTPTPTCNVGTPTTISSSVNYETVGQTTFVNFAVLLTTAGSCNGGFVLTLPFTANTKTTLDCREDVNFGTQGAASIPASSAVATIRRYDNSTGVWNSNGTEVVCSGVVQTP